MRRASGASDGARRARSTTTTRRAGRDGDGRSPRSSTRARVSIETRIWRRRQRWTTATWSATCDAFGKLARDDDDAIDALFALLNDGESRRLREGAWAEAKTRAIEASLQTTVDAAHACRRIAPRVIALIRAIVARRTRRYYRRCGRSPRAALKRRPAVAAALESVRAATTSPSLEVNRRGTLARDVSSVARRRDDRHRHARSRIAATSLAAPLRRGAAATRRVDSLPTYARDDLVRVLGDVYAFARGENDRSTRRPARWLDFGWAESPSRERGVGERDAFLEHVERVLTDECAERPNDEDESDDDVSLRSNALRPMRERLAARALRRSTPIRRPADARVSVPPSSPPFEARRDIRWRMNWRRFSNRHPFERSSESSPWGARRAAKRMN